MKHETRFVAGSGIELDRKVLYDIGQEVIDTGNSAGPVWLSRSIRSIVPESIPLQFANRNVADYEFFLRNDRRIIWEWNSDPLSVKVQNVLEPVLGFYSLVSRIKIVMQVPGQEITPHRDLITGEFYDRMDVPYSSNLGPNGWARFKGPKWFYDLYQIPDNNLHKAQDYLALKVPLDMDSSVSRSYLVHPEEIAKPVETRHIMRYDPGRQPYWLNECEVLHGVEAGEHWRGVIFIDGLLDMDVVRKSPFVPLEIF